MKIGIELNNIVRDINSQIIKYYKKDVDKNFDDSKINLKCNNLITQLPFKSNKDRNTFMYVDYAYEIFGCAKTMERNLVNSITNFEIKLNNMDDGNDYNIVHFSLLEVALTIQSSFYFLSKSGSRVREVLFPKHGIDIWNECDVVITTNKRIVKSKPNRNKVVVLIRTSDNSDIEKNADLVYDDLLSLINDDLFINKVKELISNGKEEKVSFVKKIKNKITKMFSL